jgi:hypothetical protein
MIYCPEGSRPFGRITDAKHILNPGLNGAKLSRILVQFYAPEGLQDSARGFNPGSHPPTILRPERAQDRAS